MNNVKKRRGRVAAPKARTGKPEPREVRNDDRAILAALLSVIAQHGGWTASTYVDAIEGPSTLRVAALLGILEATPEVVATEERTNNGHAYRALWIDGHYHKGRVYTVRALESHRDNIHALSYQALALRLKTMSARDALSKPPASRNNLNAMKKAA